MSEKLERARRNSMLEEGFTAGDVEFRPFTAATPLHMEALGIADQLNSLGDDAEDDDWLKAVLGIAWTLSAPIEEVNDLVFEIDEAENEEARKEARKAYRRKLLEFRAGLDMPAFARVTERITKMIQRQTELDFEIREKSNTTSKEAPPKNSSGQARRR